MIESTEFRRGNWIVGPDAEESGLQVHEQVNGGPHPCCQCGGCVATFELLAEKFPLDPSDYIDPELKF